MTQLTPGELIERQDQLPQTPPPTEEQSEAIDKFFAFMLDPEATEMHLSGPAGVGKTFTLHKIMTEGMSRYEDACSIAGIKQEIFNIELTATTNKAADVLSTTTGLPASTIHTYMGFKIKEDFKTGEVKIQISANQEIKYNTLIIIDEASMIDYRLYELLMKYTHNCKFLYVGDRFQMAPVFEELSKIYSNMGYLAELTKPMRNSSQPALMALCQQWRDTVETGVFKPIIPVPGVIDFFDGDQMDEFILNRFVNNAADPDCRIMCYSNNRVKEYNQYIRDLRTLPAYFVTGEKLVNSSAFVRGQTKISVEEEIEILDNPFIESVQTVQGQEFDTYQVKVKAKRFVGDILIPSNPEHFAQLTKWFADKKNWAGYFYLKQQFPDFRPKDASTVYKAQGSTYDTVVIDLDNISKCTHASQVARMMYVAVSRPKQRIICYGELKAAYSGG